MQFVKNLWNKEEFANVFNEILNKSWAEECDFPYLTKAYTTILCPFIKDKTFTFKNLNIILKNDEDEDEENIFYLQTFIKTSCTWLKNEGVDINEHVSDIENFFKNGNFKDVDQIINDIKK